MQDIYNLGVLAYGILWTVGIGALGLGFMVSPGFTTARKVFFITGIVGLAYCLLWEWMNKSSWTNIIGAGVAAFIVVISSGWAMRWADYHAEKAARTEKDQKEQQARSDVVDVALLTGEFNMVGAGHIPGKGTMCWFNCAIYGKGSPSSVSGWVPQITLNGHTYTGMMKKDNIAIQAEDGGTVNLNEANFIYSRAAQQIPKNGHVSGWGTFSINGLTVKQAMTPGAVWRITIKYAGDQVAHMTRTIQGNHVLRSSEVITEVP